MDLVEIRKKARAAEGQAEGSRPEVKADQSLPGSEPDPGGSNGMSDPESGAPEPMSFSAPSVAEVSGDDLLDQIFAGEDGAGLATEEIYLQGLVDQEQAEASRREQWLTFVLGREEYALPIRQVREIIKPREVTELPRVPGFLLGIISLRGLVIPVVDLRRRLDFGEVQQSDTARIIVCEQKDRIAGLLVDSITQVVHLAQQDIEPPPPMLTGIDRELVDGVGRHSGRMIILLDLLGVLKFESTEVSKKGA